MTDLKYSEDFYIRKLLNKVKLVEIMIDKMITIRMDEPFSHVEQKLREHGIRHLPVVDKDYKLIGIITQRDLFRTCPPRKDEEGKLVYDKETLDSYILEYVMTKNPVALTPSHTAADALLLMVDKKFGCIPIVDKYNTLCGIITQIDMLRIAAQIVREGGENGISKKTNETKK